jgi:hypothetical protein
VSHGTAFASKLHGQSTLQVDHVDSMMLRLEEQPTKMQNVFRKDLKPLLLNE